MPKIKIGHYEIDLFELELIENNVLVKCSKDGGKTWETKSILEITGHLNQMNLTLLYGALSGSLDYKEFAWRYANVKKGQQPSKEIINLIDSERDSARKISVWTLPKSPRLSPVRIHKYDHERKGFPLNLNKIMKSLPTTYSYTISEQVHMEAINSEKFDLLPINKLRLPLIEPGMPLLDYYNKYAPVLGLDEPRSEASAIILWGPLSIRKGQIQLGPRGRDAIVGKILAIVLFSIQGGTPIAVLTDTDEEPVAQIELPEKEESIERQVKKIVGKVFGFSRSRFFHSDNCPRFEGISPTKLLIFPSVVYATEKGKIPCDVCKPQGERAQAISKTTTEKEMPVSKVKTLERHHKGKDYYDMYKDMSLLYHALSGEQPTEYYLKSLYRELFSFNNEFERQEQYKKRLKEAEEIFSNELANNVYEHYYLPLGEVTLHEYNFERGGFFIEFQNTPGHIYGNIFPECYLLKSHNYNIRLSVNVNELPDSTSSWDLFLPMDKESAKPLAQKLRKGRTLNGKVLWKPVALKLERKEERGAAYCITGKAIKLVFFIMKGRKVLEPILQVDLDKRQEEQDLKDEILIPKQKAEVEPLTPRKLVLLFYALSGKKMDDKTILKLIFEEDREFFNRFIPKNEFERKEMEEKKAKAIATKRRELKLEMEGVVNKEYDITASVFTFSGPIFANFGEYDFKKGGFPIIFPDNFPDYSFPVRGQKFLIVRKTFGRYGALILAENFERFSFLEMHIDKAKEFLEENPDRKVKIKMYWKPMYSQELIGKKVVGEITRAEIYSSKGELINVLAEGGVVTKQMGAIEPPEGGAEQTVSRWPWEQKGDEATPTHTPQPYTGKVYASKGSRTFHRPDCTEISNIKESELISFSSPQKALEAGGIPCDTCKPKSEVTERKTKKEPSTEPFEELIEGLKGIFGGKRK